ncbi:MAG: hypothetical protein K5917_00530 [Clostridiales bacterium]|nr:hypothetical protein [Clostridiales bacterium]
MIRVNEIKLSLDATMADIKKATAKALKINESKIKNFSIYKKSIDSRKKEENIFFIFSVDVEVDGDEQEIVSKFEPSKAAVVEPFSYTMPEVIYKSDFRPVVVGFGPGGMFASLILAQAGLRPIVLERGSDVDKRTKDVKNFWLTRELNEKSNVQFGEGGAGTFSDGKLTTGIKDKRCRKIFLEFAENGAPEEILYSAKPHIGTDKLALVVKNIRKKIISLGGEIHFESKLTDIIIRNGVVYGITYEDENGHSIDMEADSVILAIGHSARDTVEMLYSKNINMMRKPFSVGARIEHPQELINKAQYGRFASHPALGAADYKLSCHSLHERGAYTFCMCPGGTVVMAASEKGGIVVNGMSEYARNSENANSALLVGIEPEDVPGDHVLGGIYYQREMEQKAFELGGKNYSAPAQLVGDFLNFTPSTKLGSVKPTCPTGVTMSDLTQVLPKKVTDTMRDAIVKMDKKLNGFALADAVLTGPETRSSSPVRILRDEFCQTNIRGLFPCGEGAGYAGGIVSAGVDGIRCAEALLSGER